jgi:hypothetical protein
LRHPARAILPNHAPNRIAIFRTVSATLIVRPTPEC